MRSNFFRNFIFTLFGLFIFCNGLAGSTGSENQKVPFPKNIPLDHFSYFQFPTDVLGFMDCREGAEITPEGNIFTGYTELIFLQGPNLSPFPLRTHYWLEKEYLPIHHWTWTIEHIQYTFSAVAAPIELNPDKPLIIFIKINVANVGQKSQIPQFAVSTRYANGESEGDGRYAPWKYRFRRPEKPLRPGLYDQLGEYFSRKWAFRFQDNSLLRNETILFSFKSAIVPTLCSYPGYPVKNEHSFVQPLVTSSPVGLTLFSHHLAPGESFDIFINMPYTPLVPGSPDHHTMKELAFSEVKEKVAGYWDALLNQGMTIHLPEAKPENVYKASLIYDLIARDKVGEDYIQKVNEFQYDEFWLRDSAYIVRSYDLGGYHDIARQCLDFFFRWQREDGNFLSQGGQFDGFGQTLWAFGQHYRLTGHQDFGLRALDSIMKAADWLETQLNSDPLGIIPVTTPGDNEAITGGHVTGHNLWALAGLTNAIHLATGLNKPDKAARLTSLYNRLARNFRKILQQALDKTGNYIPPALDQEGGQDWGNLMAVYPEEFFSPMHPAVTETLKRAKAKYSEKIMTYWDSRYLHHYLTLKNTETLIIRNDQQDALEELYAVLAHTSSTQAGFEFSIEPWSRRDFRSNLAPHGWFAAKYRNVLRDMLVRERNNSLHLMSVISPAWSKPGESIVVNAAPTNYGKISYTARFSDSGVTLSLRSQFSPSPKRLVIHIPYFVEFVSASTGQYSRGLLFVSPSITSVSIQWKQKKDARYFSFQQMVEWLKHQYDN